MEKSREAFRTISEVSESLDVPAHVLRFWETKFSQIKPLKRKGGRRYYRPGDVTLIGGIRKLLYTEGYTIRGVQRILRDHGVRFVTDIGSGAAKLSDLAQAPDVHDGDDGMATDAVPASIPAPEPISAPARARLEATLDRLQRIRTRLRTLESLSDD